MNISSINMTNNMSHLAKLSTALCYNYIGRVYPGVSVGSSSFVHSVLKLIITCVVYCLADMELIIVQVLSGGEPGFLIPLS